MQNACDNLIPAESQPPSGLLHPLIYPPFALIAGATLISNVGVWMRDTTSSCTVAGTAQHPAAVALVQAATAIPTFLLALPVGVLADHFDRRLLLILCQGVLALVGATLTILSYLRLLTVPALIVLTFAGGCAAAQILLPEPIRGRGLAIYMAATFGCMAVGSLLWGAIAETFSIPTALVLGAFGFALGAFLHRDRPLSNSATSGAIL